MEPGSRLFEVGHVLVTSFPYAYWLDMARPTLIDETDASSSHSYILMSWNYGY